MASVHRRTNRSGRPAKKYTALYFDAAQQRWRTKSAFCDREASLALAQRLERQTAREAEGLYDPVLEQAKRPIAEHLSSFLESELDPCRAPRYTQQVRARLQRVIDGIGAERIGDLTTIHVGRFLNDLMMNGRPISPATRSDYVATCKRFTAWALVHGLIHRDPLATLKSPGRPAAEVVHPRRALTDDEMARLLDAASRRPLLELETIRTGPDRGKRLGRVGFADFHSLRVSAATAYARAGMSQRTRQAAMRHTDARLTDSVYTDEHLVPIAEELGRVPPISLTN